MGRLYGRRARQKTIRGAVVAAPTYFTRKSLGLLGNREPRLTYGGDATRAR